MKLRKAIAGIAAVSVVASAMSVAASAALVEAGSNRDFFGTASMWMPVVYSDGTYDASDKDPIDYGIDLNKLASVEVVMTPGDPDFFTGDFGGALVVSSKSADDASSHNWPSVEYWGVTDEDLDIDTCETGKSIMWQKTGDLEYTLVCELTDSNKVIDNYNFVQIALQDWGFDEIKILSMTLKDASGNVMLSFDGSGNPSIAPVGAAAEATVEDAAPAQADVAAATDTTATTTATAGDTTAATTSTKGSPDTGVADVAAVAGIAVAAAGAVVLSKKRK